MGRHSQPSRARRVGARTLQAAAAVGVAGTLAFALQSTADDTGVQASSDTNTQLDDASGLMDTAEAPDQHSPAPVSPPDTAARNLTPSASAEPKVLPSAGGLRLRPSHSTEFSQTQTPSFHTPKHVSDPVAGMPTAPGGPATSPPPSPTTAPPSTPTDDGSGGSGDGALTGVVDGLGGAVGGLVGGIGHGIGGLLG